MDGRPTNDQLSKELERLRAELAELRAIQAIRHRTEADLETVELQLAGIIHSAMDAIITVDRNQRIVLFNAAAEATFGYSAQEILGEPLDRLIPERYRQVHREHLQRFGETHVTNRRMGSLGEICGLRRTGEEFPIEASISQVTVGENKFFTVILRDVTERKQAEQRIARLGRLLDESINEIYLFEAETLRFVQVNRGGRNNLGYSFEELQTLTVLDLMPNMTRDTFERLVQPLRTGTLPKVYSRSTLRRQDGSTYPVDVHIQLMDRESPPVFVAVALDLTEKVKTEQALQETQRTLATLLHNLPGMAYRRKPDAQWTMTFVSPGCRTLTGYDPDALIGNRRVSYGRDLVLPEDYGPLEAQIQAALRQRKLFQLSYRVKAADGSIKWVWDQGCGVWGGDGDLVALEGYVVDVTQERALTEQLRKAERLAELGTLASGMAHEIGTPMNVILGRAELLMRKATDESMKRGLETIVAQVERITKIMNQLLSFARKRPMERRPIDLASVVTDVLDVVQERLKKHRIEVETALNPSTPKVLADADQMSQVLLNLIINACHAMPDGGTLRIGLEPCGHMVELTVADTGCGIPETHLSKVFDPFFTTKAAGEGTGLGLTVVHGIVQEHEGTISVASRPGQGTTFRIKLPICPADS
ncbi:MAG: PAS domain S-box protein [Nitrospirae bacterium]|nr:MAG: PAS domain S-box protein [Nitrospirota bacterium]